MLVLGVLGVTTAPVLAIASIGAFVAGGAIGGVAGGTVGKAIGDIMYEKAIDLKESVEDFIEDW